MAPSPSRTARSSSTSVPRSTALDARAASCGTTRRSASPGPTSRRSCRRRTRWRRRCARGWTIRARGSSASPGEERARASQRRRHGNAVSASDARVAVSVLHWGGRADTVRCLASVAASARAPDWLFVLDNGTGALTAADVAAAASGATLLRSGENLGFAGGHNLVIRRALEAGATHVLLLNNDAVVEPGCLDALLGVAAAPGVAAVGAKVLAAGDPGRLWLAWGRVTWRAALVERVGRGAPDGPPFDRVQIGRASWRAR